MKRRRTKPLKKMMYGNNAWGEWDDPSDLKDIHKNPIVKAGIDAIWNVTKNHFGLGWLPFGKKLPGDLMDNVAKYSGGREASILRGMGARVKAKIPKKNLRPSKGPPKFGGRTFLDDIGGRNPTTRNPFG